MSTELLQKQDVEMCKAVYSTLSGVPRACFGPLGLASLGLLHGILFRMTLGECAVSSRQCLYQGRSRMFSLHQVYDLHRLLLDLDCFAIASMGDLPVPRTSART